LRLHRQVVAWDFLWSKWIPMRSYSAFRTFVESMSLETTQCHTLRHWRSQIPAKLAHGKSIDHVWCGMSYCTQYGPNDPDPTMDSLPERSTKSAENHGRLEEILTDLAPSSLTCPLGPSAFAVVVSILRPSRFDHSLHQQACPSPVAHNKMSHAPTPSRYVEWFALASRQLKED
jgi:hypothetical protein